jgi:hypothetical protein
MKLFIFSSLFLLSSYASNAQVGIGTTAPASTLDVTAVNPTGTSTSVDGILVPRVTRQRAQSMTTIPISTMIYVNEVLTGTASGTTINVTAVGFYFFNGTVWERIGATGSSNDWTTTGNTVGAAGRFIGTLDNFDVAFRRNSSAAGFIGANSTAFGAGTLAANSGINNTAFGTNALGANNTPANNTAFGFNALAANTLNSGAGNLNTAVGSGALDSLNGGARNTAVGANALTGVNDNASLDNVAVGHNALQGTGTITQSVAVGAGALLNSGSATTRSTAVGFNAGNNISLSIDSVFIGTNALGTGPTATNQIAIGAGATASGNNSVRLGNTAIGTISGQVNLTATSDRRWKENIKDSNLGLEFIKTIRPVSYFRKNDESKKTEYGFIAQELETAFVNAGDSNNAVISKDTDGMYGVRYSDFISISVKAIQEQQDQIEALKKVNDELMKTNAIILKRLEALESK